MTRSVIVVAVAGDGGAMKKGIAKCVVVVVVPHLVGGVPSAGRECHIPLGLDGGIR